MLECGHSVPTPVLEIVRQKLYDKFPAQPKPVPAPTASAKPESDAKPVEAKSVPAAASAPMPDTGQGITH